MDSTAVSMALYAVMISTGRSGERERESEQVEPIDFRHAQIRDQRIDVLCLQNLGGRTARAHRDGIEIAIAQVVGQGTRHFQIVVDHENARLFRHGWIPDWKEA